MILATEYGIQQTKHGIAMRKGGMDEVACDITLLVDTILQQTTRDDSDEMSVPPNAFIYGDASSDSSPILLTEDQSGAQSVVYPHVANGRNESLFQNHNDNTTTQQHRLHVAAACAERIRQAILTKTGFTTSMGVSTSPMLGKIASSLKKPNGLSVLCIHAGRPH